MNKNIFKTIAGLNYLNSVSKEFKKINRTISTWSIAEQVDHILKVNNSVLNSIEKETSSKVKKPLTFKGKIVLLFGYIPRRKVKAPEHVVPEKKMTEQILTELEQTIKRLQDVSAKDLEKTILINHPFIGGMSPKQWIRFLYVHQDHHLKIVRDILKK